MNEGISKDIFISFAKFLLICY